MSTRDMKLVANAFFVASAAVIVLFLSGWFKPQLMAYEAIIHELWRGFVTVGMGGKFQGLFVYMHDNVRGFSVISGGNNVVTLSAGYIGTVLVCSLYIFLSCRTRYAATMAVWLGLSMVALALILGKPDEEGRYSAFAVSLTLALVLVPLAFLDNVYSIVTLNTIALYIAILAFIGMMSINATPNFHDAERLALKSGIASHTWVLIWIAIAIPLFSAAIYFGPIHAIRKSRQL
jgi:hypothetical protein